jgi:hypothetical protein
LFGVASVLLSVAVIEALVTVFGQGAAWEALRRAEG